MRRIVLAVALLPLAALSARAQTASLPAGIPRPANDSLFRHARTLVLEGNGVVGRALVDSLLNAAAPGSSSYGDALYWHGALAATLADAERDYRRVIVEYPLAYYADDALLAIAELEQARGDRAAALVHLQRFVHEHPASPARGIAALGAARLAFEQRDTKAACAMITEARASAGAGDVELTNQISYYSSRCPSSGPATVARIGPVRTPPPTPVDTHFTATKNGAARVVPDPLSVPAAIAPAPAIMPAASSIPPRPIRAAPEVAARASVAIPRPSPAHRGRYTIQLAAYNTRPPAQELVAKLAARGVRARISGEAKPFRVRLDFYPTHKAAAAAAAELKSRGLIGFVTEEMPTP